MVVYKVLKKFRDAKTKEVYTAGQEIELSDERAEQAISTLKKWDGEFLERVEENQDDQYKGEELESLTVPELKDLATERNVTLKVAAKRDDIIEAILEHGKAVAEQSEVGE